MAVALEELGDVRRVVRRAEPLKGLHQTKTYAETVARMDDRLSATDAGKKRERLNLVEGEVGRMESIRLGGVGWIGKEEAPLLSKYGVK